jgi:hypothetical protein
MHSECVHPTPKKPRSFWYRVRTRKHITVTFYARRRETAGSDPARGKGGA